jgi:hypothetical protein
MRRVSLARGRLTRSRKASCCWRDTMRSPRSHGKSEGRPVLAKRAHLGRRAHRQLGSRGVRKPRRRHRAFVEQVREHPLGALVDEGPAGASSEWAAPVAERLPRDRPDCIAPVVEALSAEAPSPTLATSVARRASPPTLPRRPRSVGGVVQRSRLGSEHSRSGTR